MKYEIKVHDRVVGTVENKNGWWFARSVYHNCPFAPSRSRNVAENHLVRTDTAQNSR